jgi:hypothetical protein
VTTLPPVPSAWRPVTRTRLHDHEAWTLPGGGVIYVRRTEAGIEAQWVEDAEWRAMVAGLGEVVVA